MLCYQNAQVAVWGRNTRMTLDTSDIIVAFVTLLTGAVGWVLTGHYREALANRKGKAFLRLRASLRKGSTTALVYAWAMRWLLGIVDRFFEGKPYTADDDIDPASRPGRFARWFFRRPPEYRRPAEVRGKRWQAPAWSAASYDRCLLIALIYPILFAVVSWLADGQAGSLGHALGLADNADSVFRLYAGGVAVAGAACLISGLLLGGWKSWILLTAGLAVLFGGRSAADMLFATPDIRALVVAGAFAGAVAFAGGVAGAFAGAFAVAFAIAFAFAFAFAVAMNRLWLALAGVSILYFVAAYLLVNTLAAPTYSAPRLALLVGLTVLPLLNAPFDWISLGLTRYLLRLGLQRQRLRDRIVCWWADIGGAILLLLGLAVSMVVALEGLNAVGFAAGMTEPIAPVAATLHDIRAEPDAARHLWIYFALFSTLIPTLGHMLIMVFSALSANFPPMQRFIVRRIDQGPDAGYNTLIAFLLSVRWIIAIGTTAALAYGIYRVGSEVADVWEDLLWLLIEVQKAARAVFVG